MRCEAGPSEGQETLKGAKPPSPRQKPHRTAVGVAAYEGWLAYAAVMSSSTSSPLALNLPVSGVRGRTTPYGRVRAARALARLFPNTESTRHLQRSFERFPLGDIILSMGRWRPDASFHIPLGLSHEPVHGKDWELRYHPGRKLLPLAWPQPENLPLDFRNVHRSDGKSTGS